MKQDLKQEAMLEIKAFKTQLYKSYRDHNENFEASVDDMIPFLKTHIDAYIQSRVQFFKPIPANELIYRCRNTDEKLEIKFSEFSAPPADKTQNLRMSREGTSYFYGAFDLFLMFFHLIHFQKNYLSRFSFSYYLSNVKNFTNYL